MRKISNLLRSSFPTPLLISALLFSSISIILNPSPAFAAICREIESIKRSTNVDINTKVGGHLTQHIDGLTPPTKLTQEGKTLFESKGKFEAAWRRYQFISNPANCTSGVVQQVVTVEKLKLQHLGAVKCIDANTNGRCTRKEHYVAEKVAFAFRQIEGEWILVTAYPVPLLP